MSKGIIVERAANEELPKEFLEHMHKKFPSSWGYACVLDGKLQVGSNLNVDVETIKDTLEACNDLTVTFHLGEGVEHKDDPQPFQILRNDDDTPLLVCFAEGDFEDYADATGHTAEYHFVTDWLTPHITSIYELSGKDLAKLETYLKSENFAKTLSKEYGDRGVITFVSPNGSGTLATNDEYTEFKWGWASQSPGYKEYPDAGKATEPDALPADSIAARIAKRKAEKEQLKGSTALPDGVHKVPDKKPTAQAPLQEDIKNAAALAEENGSVLPDTEIFPDEYMCSTKNLLQQFYNGINGHCPNGYELAVGAPEKAIGLKFKNLNKKFRQDIQTMGDLKKKLEKRHGTLVRSTGKAPADGESKAKEVVVGGLPIIGPNELIKADKFFKSLDLKSQEIMHPDHFDNIEEKYATFWDKYPDMTMEKTWEIEYKDIMRLCKEFPDTAALWLFNLRNFQAKVVVSQKKPEEKPAKEEKPAENSLAARLAARKAQRM